VPQGRDQSEPLLPLVEGVPGGGRNGSDRRQRETIEAFARRAGYELVDEFYDAAVIRGAISEFDKAMTIAKLRGARERKRREAGKYEGRKSHAERDPELLALAKRLHRQKPKGGRMSLRAISGELAAQGFLNENARPFAAASVKSMLD
jgi:transposase